MNGREASRPRALECRHPARDGQAPPLTVPRDAPRPARGASSSFLVLVDLFELGVDDVLAARRARVGV
jgi:hypothetical protein